MWLFTSCHQRIGLVKIGLVKIGPGGPKLAAKIGPGRPKLAAKTDPSGFIVHYCLFNKWQVEAGKQTTGMDYTLPI